MEIPENDSSISFLDTKCSPNSDHTIHTSVYRKPTHTDCYLDWNSKHPISAKKAVIHEVVYRAKNVCSTPEILAKEMDYLHEILKNNIPNLMIKESENKPTTPIINPDTGLKGKQNVIISVPYVPGLSEEFRRMFQHTSVQVLFKEANTPKSILMHHRR